MVLDPCTNVQCKNGAECLWKAEMGEDYECVCKAGYGGKLCELSIFSPFNFKKTNFL